MVSIISVLISVLLAGVAQLLFKKGVSSDISFSELNLGKIPWLFVRVIFHPHIFLGFSTYALAIVFWLFALSKLDFSYVFPFISLTLVITSAGAWMLFGEKISLYRKIGIGIICLGVLLIAQS